MPVMRPVICIGQSIGRQRILGMQMGDELDEQNELLTDIESGVDRHCASSCASAERSDRLVTDCPAALMVIILSSPRIRLL